ncbi:MAG: putative Ig domain-containing protein [Kofleriaceae bacterium]
MAEVGASYGATLDTVGGGAGTTWSLVAGDLPDGLTLTATGATATIAGTVTEAATPGAYPLVVRVIDADGVGADTALALHVNPAGVAPLEAVGGRLPTPIREGEQSSTLLELPPGDLELALVAGELPPEYVVYPLSFLSSLGFVFGPTVAGVAAASPWRLAVSLHDPATGAWGQVEYLLDVLDAGAVYISQGDTTTLHVDEDSTLTGPFNSLELDAIDADAGPASLAWTIATAPAHGTAAVLRGAPSSSGAAVEIGYAPVAGYAGPDAFVVEVDDGDGHTDRISVEVDVSGHDNTFTWDLLNGGAPLDPPPGGRVAYGEISTVQLADGSLAFSGRGERLGRYLGRVTPAGAWQYLTPTGWRGGDDVTPMVIEHAHNAWGTLELYPHPTIADGLIGVAQQGFRVGDQIMDSHGVPTNVVFDGQRWSTWNGGTADDPYLSAPLIYSWNGTGSAAAGFAYDPVEREGLVVGRIGFAISNYQSQLAAARLDLTDAAQRWRRWHREPGTVGGWHVDASWPNVNDHDASRKAFVLDAGSSLTAYRFDQARVVHLPGGRDFLTLFTLTDTASNLTVLGAARYRGASATWEYWGGASWSDASASGYLGAIPSLTGAPVTLGTTLTLRALPGGDALAVFVDGGTLRSVRYDAAAASFTTAALGPAVRDRGVAVAAAPDGSTWVLSSRDGLRVEQRRHAADGTWSSPALAYATGETLDVVGLGFVGARAVGLVRPPQVPGVGRTELRAIGETPAVTWADEVPVVWPTPTAAPALPGYAVTRRVANYASGASYGTSPAYGLAADDDGYVYAARYPVCSVIVQPPSSTGVAENHSWGLFWDYFDFPGAIALDRSRGKLYATNGLLAGGAGAVGGYGQVRVWDYQARRDDSVGWQALSGGVPAGWLSSYADQQFASGLAWPGGVAVDEAAGMLVVTSSLDNRLRIYDIHDTTSPNGAMTRADLATSRVRAADHALVAALVDELVDLGLLTEVGGGAQVRWAAASWAEVEAAIVASPSVAAMAAASRPTVQRNLHGTWQQRHDLPVLRFETGAHGTGPGQFAMPTGLARGPDGDLYVVDTDNHRVQRLHPDYDARTLTHVRTMGGFGRGPGQLLHPINVTVSAAGDVFVADPNNARVVVFDADTGAYAYEFGSIEGGAGATALDATIGLAALDDGTLLLGDGDDVVTLTRTP